MALVLIKNKCSTEFFFNNQLVINTLISKTSRLEMVKFFTYLFLQRENYGSRLIYV